jgi:multidrug efflux pump subunit AcrA (membrane-fusion protein)
MDAIMSRRTLSLAASAVLITSLAAAAFAVPVAAAPSEQQEAAKQARADARAEAKAARQAAKEARAEARAEAKAARQAAKEARAEARAEAKAARQAAKEADSQKVTVCHKPGTPAEGTLEISASALEAHLAHGDIEGPCRSATAPTAPTCEEPGTSDAEASLADGTDGDDGVVCDEPEPLVVSIDAPESIESQDALQLQGEVNGPEAGDLRYVWSSTCLTDEQLTDPAIIASEPGTALLVVREDTLSPGVMCDFTLMVTDEATGENGSATVTVEVVTLP